MNSKVIIQSGRGLSPGMQRGKILAEVMEMFSECKHSTPAFLSLGKCFIPRSTPTRSLMPCSGCTENLGNFSKRIQKRLLSSILFSFHHSLCARVQIQCKFVQEWCFPGFVCTPTAAELVSCRGQGSCSQAEGQLHLGSTCVHVM